MTILATSLPAQRPAPPSSTPQQFQTALVLAQKGESARALEIVDQLLQCHPDFVPALKLQGMLLEDAGRTNEASAAYETGLKLAPNDADLLYKVGVVRLVNGQANDAIVMFEHHLRLEPRDADALYYLAQAQHLAGHDDLALNTIRACMKAKPNDPAVWQKYGELLISSGDNETAFDWLTKAKQTNPRLPRIDFDLALVSFNRMDFRASSQYLETAVTASPGSLETLRLYAMVKAKLLQWQEAKAAYDRILAQNSSDSEALLGLGRAQLGMMAYPEAVETLTRLIEIDPTIIEAHYSLSKAYAALGNQPEAQHQADLHHRMVEQTSFATSVLGNEQDRSAWGKARQLLAAGHEQEALQLFQAAEKGSSASAAHPYFLLGALYLYLGNSADGLRNLHRALELDPKVRGAHTYLGIYELQHGALDRAEKDFQAEIANDPNYQAAVAEMGVVRFHQQRWQEAADQLSRSHTKSPAQLLMLCDAYFRLNRSKDANLTAEIAAAYGRTDQEFMEALVELLNSNGQTELARRLAPGTTP